MTHVFKGPISVQGRKYPADCFSNEIALKKIGDRRLLVYSKFRSDLLPSAEDVDQRPQLKDAIGIVTRIDRDGDHIAVTVETLAGRSLLVETIHMAGWSLGPIGIGTVVADNVDEYELLGFSVRVPEVV